jgi:hypothetical protein
MNNILAKGIAAVLGCGGTFVRRTRHLRRQVHQRYEDREVVEGALAR